MKINKLIIVLLPACLAFNTLSLADDGATEKRILADTWPVYLSAGLL